MDKLPTDSLTARQKECLRLVSRDRDAKEIARILGLSPETVRGHVKAAMARLGTNSRYEAARRLAAAEATDPWRGDPSWGIGSTPVPVEHLGPHPSTVDEAANVVREDRAVFVYRHASDETAVLPGAAGNDLTIVRLLRIVKLVFAIALILLLAGPLSVSFQNIARLVRNAIS